MIDARKFCATPGQEARDWLTVPSADDHFVYACDGARAIRVQRTLYGIEANNLSEVNSSLVKNFQAIETFDYQQLPEIIFPKTTPCLTCSRTGLVDICDTCKGVAHITCPCCEHEATCQECSYGVVNGSNHCCASCYGIGHIKENGQQDAIHLFDSYLHFAYLFALIKLPELQVSQPTDPMEVIKFRFTGGHALVMPRRK